MSNSYYAMQDAKRAAALDGLNWDRMGAAKQDEYIAAEMIKRGYVKQSYMGAGAYRWGKK